MSTLLWQILGALGAVLALALVWVTSLAKAKGAGVIQQQAADAKRQEADLEKASAASGEVGSLSDADVLRELHAGYDRKPVRLGEGDHRQP